MARQPSPSPEILVAGAGAMAVEHLLALLALGVDARSLLVVGRDPERAAAVGRRFGVEARGGGAENSPVTAKAAVVAVSDTELAGVTLGLIEAGCRRILVEKPGGIERDELERVAAAARAADAAVYVAYNRRFYPSVEAVRRFVAEDGGLISCSFDFTEIEEQVLRAAAEKAYPPHVLARWGILNSVHVIDLFLHLAGPPRDWEARRAGALRWHPSGAVFAGSGVTEHEVTFSYLSTWSGAGRWGVELTTQARKLVLRPLEALQAQEKGSFALTEVALDGEPDGLKPGFHGQLGAFLSPDPDERLCTIDEALRHFAVAEEILGYR